MSVLLRILVFASVAADLVAASRSEVHQVGTKRSHNQDSQIFSVTPTGHLIAKHVFTQDAPMALTSGHNATVSTPTRSIRRSARGQRRSKRRSASLAELRVRAAAQPFGAARTGHSRRKRGPSDVEGDSATVEDSGASAAKKLEDAVTLSFNDKMMLEVGWLVECIFIVLVGCVLSMWWPYNYIGAKDIEPSAQEKLEESDSSPSLSRWLYESMWGVNQWSSSFNALIVMLSLLNFGVFAMQSERHYLSKEAEDPNMIAINAFFGFDGVKDMIESSLEWNGHVQTISLGVFGTLIILRMVGSRAHPSWKSYGTAAPLYFLAGDFYTHVEILALLPSAIDLLNGTDAYMNFCCLSLVRSMEMMWRQGSIGSALRQMQALKEMGPVLNIIWGIAIFLWLTLSGLYYLANNDNENSQWEAVKDGNGHWQRFDSIPSSMFFVLLNLSKEYPLADVHETFFQRILVMFTCIIGVPLFSIPTGIVGNSLQKKTAEEITHRQTNQAGTWTNLLPGNQATGESFDTSIEATNASAEVQPTANFEDDTAFKIIEFALSFGSVLIYFFWTASRGTAFLMLWINIDISDGNLAIVDGLVGTMFFCTLVVHVRRAFQYWSDDSEAYFMTLGFLVDVFASLPGMVHFVLHYCVADSSTLFPVTLELLAAACVIRVLKPERHMGAFKVMFEIMNEHRALLQATGYLAFLILLVVSTLLYFTERDSPDEEMRFYYGSAARALWAQLINLHGEWVWCDYSAPGKAIGTIVDFLAIGLCMVPIAVFADGFSDRITSSAGETSLEMRPWQASHRPEEEGGSRNLWDLFYKHLSAGDSSRMMNASSLPQFKGWRAMRIASISAILVSVAATVFVTLKRFDVNVPGNFEENGKMIKSFYTIDGLCFCFFGVELLLRSIATNGKHVLSFVGACDVISLVALTASLNPTFRPYALHPQYDTRFIDDFIVPFRLLRCFCLENYFHGVHAITSVMYVNRKPLRQVFYALVCVWYIFGTSLYLCERQWPGEAKEKADPALLGTHSQDAEDADGGDELAMDDRFKDILTGLQYTLVHLTGDYPIAEYKMQSIPFHFVFAMAGLMLTSALAGIFTAGFYNYLEQEHKIDRQKQAAKAMDRLTTSTLVVQHRFRRALRRRRAGAQAAQQQEPAASHPFPAIRDLMDPRSSGFFITACNVALVVNIFNTLASSVDEIETSVAKFHVLAAIEISTWCVFIVEYIFQLMAARRPFSNVLQKMRIIDFLCLLPTVFYIANGMEDGEGAYTGTYFTQQQIESGIECARVLRVLRIADMPLLRKTFQKTGTSLGAAFAYMDMPLVCAFNIWVFSSGIFMWVENFYKGPDYEENMPTIPDALYWTSIFIIGEWANVDFSPGAGSRLCIFYCLVGVMIFAIPVGMMAEAVRSAIEASAAEEEEVRRLVGLGKKELIEDVTGRSSGVYEAAPGASTGMHGLVAAPGAGAVAAPGASTGMHGLVTKQPQEPAAPSYAQPVQPSNSAASTAPNTDSNRTSTAMPPAPPR